MPKDEGPAKNWVGSEEVGLEEQEQAQVGLPAALARPVCFIRIMGRLLGAQSRQAGAQHRTSDVALGPQDAAIRAQAQLFSRDAYPEVRFDQRHLSYLVLEGQS